MTRVTTGSRLHFGLMSAGDLPGVPRFGGLGLMVNEPAVIVQAERSLEWSASGPSAERALTAAKAVVDDGEPLKIVVEACPPEHVGLGVGTQLALAAGTAALREVGRADAPSWVVDATGRGGRSGVGMAGFYYGGFLHDEGKRDDVRLPIRRDDWNVPWAVVLARPGTSERWHGATERAAFSRPRDADRGRRVADDLRSLAEAVIVPALRTEDFSAFGNALYEYNRLAGEAFAADQGGVYSSSGVGELVEAIRRRGVTGVGQSSWGPTVFAFCGDRDEAEELAAALRLSHLDLDNVTATDVRNRSFDYEEAS